MPSRSRYQDLDFDIHVDSSCASDGAEEKPPAMEHDDAVGSQEATCPEQGSHASVGQDGTMTNIENIKHGVGDMEVDNVPDQDSPLDTENLQPTVEEVADELEDDSLLHSNVWAERDGPESRREPASSDVESCHGNVEGRSSGRTEALIHAAAKEIVEAIASDSSRDSIQSAESAASAAEGEDGRQSLGVESDAGQSRVSEVDHAEHAAHADEGGDSSSHHEHEDDVFSDNSPRSSVGSVSEAERESAHEVAPPKTRTARISDIPQSDADEEFSPAIRGTQRPTFRSPSSVMAMQMSSPPASATATPRSSRRTPRSTVSRLGSPSLSMQYSPKKTPPRFRRNTPPLILLHVTVLPSRWPWGHVLDHARPSDLSPEAKTLWESWNQLQDRTGDTISDRGILLPHPQNDYEVLEERLLETLELPLRRRARILECGHYLGPSNEMSLPEEIESEDEDHCNGRRSTTEQTHWCTTCSSQIRYDSLGDGKVYRVKVYASNGLMRAGAWEACWKEMERVDVELEPIIDSKLQEELNCLAAEQQRAVEMEEQAAAAAAFDEEMQRCQEAADAEQSYTSDHVDVPVHMEEPCQPQVHGQSSPSSYEEDRRMRDEERLREVYGASPPPEPEYSSSPQPRRSDLFPQETPISPSVEALERREERRESRQQTDKSASLPELILEAAKVLMQDQKNVLIGLLSLVVLVLALRSGAKPTEIGFESVIPQPVAQVAVGKPVESVSGIVDPPKAEVEHESAQAASAVQHESNVESMERLQLSGMTQELSETPSNVMPMSTIEITKTVTKAVTETRTETVVETVVKTGFETTTELLTNTITETVAETITETLVETVEVEALPTEIPGNAASMEHSEAVEEEIALEKEPVGDGDGDGDWGVEGYDEEL
ncbi:pathway-specific nitrogen regulator [Metarhizium album ARSEF 1941]|uniref:Pathway-specific nitrogen regulator n=1 Tax=Metarhizium album (strain ARSEF 1941) TaxID=1081103 RepID=A0A0B2WNH0_METAS|nr:pathway-specific nitrogen regulator [Metarhizium album ARSEF 1941]KHN95513.1 pathway-specific nitrogen regulator [Metarhizium album ARSEF 1941]